MSTHYLANAVAVENGGVVLLEDLGASYYTYNSTIQAILWPVIEHMNVKPLTDPFPWFESKGMFDGSDGGARPLPEHTFSPHDILKDLQWVEREVAKRPRRYPATWTFEVQGQPGAPGSTHSSLPAYYNGRAVLLYGEGKDCWAKETTPGPREGIHHPLTGSTTVSVTLFPDGPGIQVLIRRSPFSPEYPAVMAGLKRVCYVATQRRARVLTQYVH